MCIFLFPETNNAAMPRAAVTLIRKLRRRGAISPEHRLASWLIGPADIEAKIQALLTAEEKACVFMVAMGGSIVDGFLFGNSAATLA